MAPWTRTNVGMYSTRMPVLPGDLADRNRAYPDHYGACLASFGNLVLEAYFIGLTGATYPFGPQKDRAFCEQLSRAVDGRPVFSASIAILDALRALAARDLRYLGLIGSRAKVKKIYDALVEEGMPLECLQRVHAPIGLDIGGVTPEEIAISIMAEIIAVRRGRIEAPNVASASLQWAADSINSR